MDEENVVDVFLSNVEKSKKDKINTEINNVMLIYNQLC